MHSVPPLSTVAGHPRLFLSPRRLLLLGFLQALPGATACCPTRVWRNRQFFPSPRQRQRLASAESGHQRKRSSMAKGVFRTGSGRQEEYVKQTNGVPLRGGGDGGWGRGGTSYPRSFSLPAAVQRNKGNLKRQGQASGLFGGGEGGKLRHDLIQRFVYPSTLCY